MTVSTTTIDRIVANVLSQLSPNEQRTESVVSQASSAKTVQSFKITETVITADVLENVQTGQSIQIPNKSIVTPAANDLIRERQLTINRSDITKLKKSNSDNRQPVGKSKLSVAIVRHTEAVRSAISDLRDFSEELLSCPDDAAKYAISEICRSGVGTVLIFVEQTHRAACFANRNEKVKAVIVNDTGDVKAVRKQLRANVWCLDPTDRSYFELKNVLRAITQ